MAAETCQALQRLVELVWHKRGGKPTEAEALGNDIGIIDVALGGVGESLLESLDQARVEGVDLGVKGRKLRTGVKEAGKVPPVEVSSFQPNQEVVQMIALHQYENLPDQLLSAGKIVGHSEAAPGFSAILKERTTGIFCHGYIDAQVKVLVIDTPFC